MSTQRNPTPYQVARAGEYFVAGELHRRGAFAVPFLGNMPGIDLMASNIDQTRTVTVQVKTKHAGTWQTRTTRGCARDEVPDEDRFWIFVDLEADTAYYIVPEWWIQNDIYRSHEEYLARHGGHRVRNDQSDHHAVSRKRIEQWRDRWDLLRLF